MAGKVARSAVDFLPDGTDAYPAYNIAFAVIISRRRPDKAKPLSGIPYPNHTVNDSTFSNAARSVSGVNVTGRA